MSRGGKRWIERLLGIVRRGEDGVNERQSTDLTTVVDRWCTHCGVGDHWAIMGTRGDAVAMLKKIACFCTAMDGKTP